MKMFTKNCFITFAFPSRLDAGFLGHEDLLSAPGAFRMKIGNIFIDHISIGAGEGVAGGCSPPS